MENNLCRFLHLLRIQSIAAFLSNCWNHAGRNSSALETYQAVTIMQYIFSIISSSNLFPACNTRSLRHLYFLKSTVINVTICSKSVSEFKTNSTFTNIPSFSSSNYAAARPRYTEDLLNKIFEYHKSGSALSVDLGCGPGTITSYLSERSNHVLGVDPSSNMLNEAKKQLDGLKNVELHQGLANELPSLLSEPADLIVSAQAAHWFHSPPNNTSNCDLWKDIGASLRSGGSLVYLVYGDIEVLNYPNLSAFQRVKDILQPYWQQPGRRFLVNLLRDVEFPEWGVNTHRQFFDKETGYVLKNSTSISAFSEYISTWSSYSKYLEQSNANTQLIEQLNKDIKEEVGGDKPLEIAFPVALFMCQKE